MKFYYVYILQSLQNPHKYYTGFTENLEQRVHEHNMGKCSHTYLSADGQAGEREKVSE